LLALFFFIITTLAITTAKIIANAPKNTPTTMPTFEFLD